jgi:hypothetical protein
MPKQRDPAYAVLAAAIGPLETWCLCCFWCESPIVTWDGTGSMCGILHHDDGVHDNNVLENIVPMYQACHSAYHRSLDGEKHAEIARRVNAARTPEQLSEVGRKRVAKRSAEERSDSGRRMNSVLNARLTHEQRVAAGRKAGETRRANRAAALNART